MSASASQKICLTSQPRDAGGRPTQARAHLHVHQLEDPGVIQSENAFHDQDVWRIDGSRPVKTSMILERIDGDLGTFTTSGLWSDNTRFDVAIPGLTRLSDHAVALPGRQSRWPAVIMSLLHRQAGTGFGLRLAHQSRTHCGKPFWMTLGPGSYRMSPTDIKITNKPDDSYSLPGSSYQLTMDRMTTQGRFNLFTIAWDSVDLPEPELPAIPMMLTSAQGGA